MISDFQLVLIGIAAVVIVGVIIYNRWQEARYKRQAENAFAHVRDDRGDALFGEAASRDARDARDARIEPSIGAFGAIDRVADHDMNAPAKLHTNADDDLSDLDLKVDTQANVVAPPSTARGFASHAPTRANANDLVPSINTEVDTVALIMADAPVDADTYAPMIAESQAITQGAGTVLWEGLVGGLWVPIDPTADERYRELRAGLQLANRAGAVDPAQIAAFDAAMRTFAERINAVSQREDTTDAARRAQMVDQFCAETDVEIAVNLIGRNGVTFATTKVRGLAEAQGFTALPTGEFAMRDELGRVLFVLRNGNAQESPAIRRDQSYLTQLTFAIDVPRTPNAAENFQRMYTLVLQFADVLQADVVDDNRKVLTANGRKVIHDTIREILGEMQQKGITSGSSTALRLYA